MVRPLIAFSALLLFGSSRVLSQILTADVPLEVVVDGPSDDARAVQGHITNIGTRTATAWSLRIAFTYSDRPRSTSYMDQDNYHLVAVPAPDGHGPLRAGQSVAFIVGLPDTILPIATSIVPVAVVYDDGTGIGQTERVDAIFARRLRDVDAAKEIVSELQTLVTNGRLTTEALQQLSNDLKATASSEQDLGLRSVAVSNIAVIIWRQQGQPASLSSGVASLISLFNQYLQGAQQHSQRR